MGAVVLTVIVAETAELPLMSTEDGMLHVAGSIAPEGLDVERTLKIHCSDEACVPVSLRW